MSRRLFVALLMPVLLTAGDVRGRVVDAITGEALEGVLIRVHRFEGAERDGTATTAEDGSFSFPLDAASGFRLLAYKPGHASSALYASAGEAGPLLIRVFAGAVVSGRVLSEGGQPAVRVQVQLLRRLIGSPQLLRAQTLDGAPAMAMTDSHGDYRLYGLAGGEYVLAAIPVLHAMPAAGTGVASAASTLRSITLAAGEKLAGIDFSLPQTQAGSLMGRLEAASMESPVLLSLTSRDLPALPLAQTLAGADGSFQFHGIPAGAYTLFAAGPSSGSGGYAGFLGSRPSFARAVVAVTSGGNEEAASRAQAGRTATFQLAGTCAPTAQLRLTALEGWGVQLDQTAQLSTKAPTEVEGLAPAIYAVSATSMPEGCFAAPPEILDLTGGAPAAMQIRALRGSGLRGKIVGARQTGKPRFLILLWPDMRNADQPTFSILLAEDSGYFSAQNVASGRYRVVVLRDSSWGDPLWAPDVSSAVDVDLLPGGQTSLELPAPPA